MAEVKKDEPKKPVTVIAHAPNIDWGEDISEPDIEGWHDPEITPVVMGRIEGFKVIETDNGPSDCVIMRLLAPVKCKGNKGETIDLAVNQTIGVFVRNKLTPLLEYVEFKNVMRIETDEKVPIKGGKTMWKFKIIPAKNSKRGAPPRQSIYTKTTRKDEPDIDFP